MEKSNALSILKSRKTISSPGKYPVKVTSVTPNYRENAQGPAQVAIVNVNAMTPYHFETAKAHFKAGEYQEAVNQNLTISVRENDYMPSKGETVDVIVENIITNSGQEGLFITSPAIEKKAAATSAFNVESFLDGLEEGTSILAEEATEASFKEVEA